jgi:hypothetical protein
MSMSLKDTAPGILIKLFYWEKNVHFQHHSKKTISNWFSRQGDKIK